MKTRRSERGQVLVLVALAIIGLVGITGLAIDGSVILADRRDAQNAADGAALAGALDRLRTREDVKAGTMSEADSLASMRLVAWDRAEQNGYLQPGPNSSVEVYLCSEVADGASCPAPYTGKNQYVQVIITSDVDTYFARALGVDQLQNRVQAIALADDDDTGPLFGGAAIYATNPDCPPNGSLILNGGNGTNINITGGAMASNSDDACAVVCGLNNATVNIPGGITTPGGGFTWNGQCTTSSFPHSDTATQMDYPDEIPVLPVPPECDGSNPTYWGHQTFGTYFDPATGANVTASFITPGYYNGFPPKALDGVNVKNTIVMAPGVYCVDSVLKQISNPVHVYGDDVTIYVRAGNNITVNGGVVQLRATNGDGAPYDPYGTSNEAYQGYLFIAEPDYDGAVTACTFEGNAINIYVGAIFTPHCDLTINGNGETPPDGIISQLIGFNVKINGSTNLTVKYDSDLNPAIVDPPKTGITR